MQPVRDVLRGSLARSLRALAEEDRLAAAWPLVCGSALVAHCAVVHFGEDRVVRVRVDGPAWLAPMLPIRDRLRYDLERVSGVAVAGLHFIEAGPAPRRGG